MKRSPVYRSQWTSSYFLLGVTLLLSLLLAGCSGVAASAPVPVDEALPPLPAGEEGVALDLGDGPPLGPSMGVNDKSQPDRLELPSIAVDTDVVKIGWQLVDIGNGQTANTWEVADFAAGWHKNSSLPGESGNIVLSAHNNIRGAVFRKLYQLEPGDQARLWAGGRQFVYEVEEVMILEEKFAPMEQRRENARWIQQFDDDRLTLVSCWPETDNTHRVIVVAKPVEEISSQ